MSEKLVCYSRYEEIFPRHLIIRKEFGVYRAYNLSALALSRIMHFPTGEDRGKIATGSIDKEEIIKTLMSEKYSFIVIEDGIITKQYDGRYPFGEYIAEPQSASKRHETGDILKIISYPANLLRSIFKDDFPDLPLTLSDLSPDIFSRMDYVLSSLKPRNQEIMLMRFKEGKSYQEIGDILGMSRQGVEQHVRYAIKRIKKDAYFNQHIRKEIIINRS